MPISEIEDVFAKYRKQEEIINSKINQTDGRHVRTEDNGQVLQDKLYSKSLGQAKERNRLILKNLETVKGNLRSKAIYSPSEIQWKKIQENYRAEPSLPINRWRCHLPVVV
ncbi:uncharacterized protein LOC108915728 [Anoplophora glabripennis]|uniref:uncharacterized protein LOC108915728 n=1 Tax=Anoplophora glabripennis TaxID=217634 RepID=UPI0008759DBA|nr:uncharacterized protein LOC108915728 [Anoplophora glabripennis]